MCVAIDGVVKRNLARRFKIKTVFTQDDPRCIEEVVTRRIKHSIENPKGAFGELPDVIFADGGINQIHAIQAAINNVALEVKDIDKKNNLNEIKVFGMVKNDKHETRALMDSNRNELKISDELLNLITLFQDSVHDLAIGYHKKLREKEMIHSELDDIEGIGPTKKKLLMQSFGSVERIKKASIEELMNVKGITKEIAKRIKGE